MSILNVAPDVLQQVSGIGVAAPRLDGACDRVLARDEPYRFVIDTSTP